MSLQTTFGVLATGGSLGTRWGFLPILALWLGSFDFVSWGKVFSAGIHPFVPGDLVKLMGASLVVGGLWTIADRGR